MTTRTVAAARREKLPVYRPSGGRAYLASPDEIRQLVRGGMARAVCSRRRLTGAVLFEGPSRSHAGTRYVHQHHVAETWTDRDGKVHSRHPLEPNVRGVYTFRRITDVDRALYMTVQTECLR
jgi:hypothetical protein